MLYFTINIFKRIRLLLYWNISFKKFHSSHKTCCIQTILYGLNIQLFSLCINLQENSFFLKHYNKKGFKWSNSNLYGNLYTRNKTLKYIIFFIEKENPEKFGIIIIFEITLCLL
jgi:hypothetical protein